MENKLKIQIWSDIACPFCYIGKRRLEQALAQFRHEDAIEIEWKSFQLDASIPEVANESYHEYLIIRKGMARLASPRVLANITETASHVGLNYHLDKSIDTIC